VDDFTPHTPAAAAGTRVLVAAGWAVAALGAVVLILAGAVLAAAAAVALGSLRGASVLRVRRAARPRAVPARSAEVPAVIPKQG
jgi:hypothetical protein